MSRTEIAQCPYCFAEFERPMLSQYERSWRNPKLTCSQPCATRMSVWEKWLQSTCDVSKPYSAAPSLGPSLFASVDRFKLESEETEEKTAKSLDTAPLRHYNSTSTKPTNQKGGQAMRISKGDSVVTPTGRKATVKSFDKVVTGKRGRPAHLAVVQLRNTRGNFEHGTVSFRKTELQPA